MALPLAPVGGAHGLNRRGVGNPYLERQCLLGGYTGQQQRTVSETEMPSPPGPWPPSPWSFRPRERVPSLSPLIPPPLRYLVSQCIGRRISVVSEARVEITDRLRQHQKQDEFS